MKVVVSEMNGICAKLDLRNTQSSIVQKNATV